MFREETDRDGLLKRLAGILCDCISTVELARRLQLAQSTASQSVEGGEKIVAEKQLRMSVDLK